MEIEVKIILKAKDLQKFQPLLLHLSKVLEDCPTECQYPLSHLLDTFPQRVTKRDNTFPQKIVTLSFF